MDPITRYFNLISQRPELFTPSQHVPLCLDEATVRAYAASTGRPVGVVYAVSSTTAPAQTIPSVLLTSTARAASGGI